MQHKELTSLSKFLSYLLRHGAHEYDLTLDEEGFASLDAVWDIVSRRYPRRYERSVALPILLSGELDGKQRFALDGDRIRALYGHSRVREIVYEPATPPAHLFHGTTSEALEAIRQEGIRPMQRQYVHLSLDEARALSVARRHSPHPILLRVDTSHAMALGVVFFQPDETHFLAREIPFAAIEIVT